MNPEQALKKARIFKNPDWADQITKAFIDDIDEQPSIEKNREEKDYGKDYEGKNHIR